MSLRRIAFVCLVSGMCCVALPVAPSRAASTAPERAMATERDPGPFRGFDAAVARHLALHESLAAEAPGPLAGSSAQQVSDASHRLAAAIRAARPRARRGEFFDGEAVAAIEQRIRTAMHASADIRLRDIDDERPAFKHPRIHIAFPSTEMATMPHALLRVLPELPDALEYRIVGEYLVLRDVKAALVLDYVAAAVPRRER